MKKSESNRINARKSTGPRTPRGKQASRQNALKHGFFGRELLVSESDRPEFEQLRAELGAQLQPRSPLQEIAFQTIVSCCWRCKLAHRLEAKHFTAQLQAGEQEDARTPESDQPRYIAQWYGTNRMTLRTSIRELERIEEEFKAQGYFKEETIDYLTRTFGPDFVVLLTNWLPAMSVDAILMANSTESHSRTFGFKMPNEDRTPSDVVRDPQQSYQMVKKLLEERRQFLQEVLRLTEQKWISGEVEVPSDFNPRFLVAANRDLQRAVDWFLYLRTKEL